MKLNRIFEHSNEGDKKFLSNGLYIFNGDLYLNTYVCVLCLYQDHFDFFRNFLHLYAILDYATFDYEEYK